MPPKPANTGPKSKGKKPATAPQPEHAEPVSPYAIKQTIVMCSKCKTKQTFAPADNPVGLCYECRKEAEEEEDREAEAAAAKRKKEEVASDAMKGVEMTADAEEMSKSDG